MSSLHVFFCVLVYSSLRVHRSSFLPKSDVLQIISHVNVPSHHNAKLSNTSLNLQQFRLVSISPFITTYSSGEVQKNVAYLLLVCVANFLSKLAPLTLYSRSFYIWLNVTSKRPFSHLICKKIYSAEFEQIMNRLRFHCCTRMSKSL